MHLTPPPQYIVCGMDNYPKTLVGFRDRFNTEDACLQYLASIRWPQGYVCPQCAHDESWQTKRGLYQCQKCRHQASITAGTIFHDSKKPLRLWFEAMWYITNQKYGTNALGLQRVLGLGSYHTAWKWLHKLRRAMIRPGREKLTGTIEVDETFIGGKRPGKRGRGAENKTIVAVAVEDTAKGLGSKGIGRIRLMCIPDASSTSLNDFICNNVAPGSCVRTDGWSGYEQLSTIGYKHVIAGSRGLIIAHIVISLMKRWLLGTYQGAVTPTQLDYYLDEYTFRFNRRKSASRGMLFYRLVQQAVTLKPILGNDLTTYNHLTNEAVIADFDNVPF